MEFLSDYSWAALWPLIIMFIALGAAAGFLAGLLGIGGGLVLVPGLFYGLVSLGFPPEQMMHVAVGTSLAVIIPTGLSSAQTHYKRGAVRLDLVKKLGIGVVLGVALGTIIAGYVSGAALRMIFAGAITLVALLMLGNPARFQLFNGLPRQPFTALAGGFIGMLSTLMGVGGATMSVPFMTVSRVPIHTAVGTASALGLVIAVPAALGFILIGLGNEIGMPFSLGYINLLAWLVIFPASVLTAPLGAYVAHRASVEGLRKFFAVFMLLVAARMVYGVFYGG